MRTRTFLIIVLCIILAISGCGKTSDDEKGKPDTRNSVSVTNEMKEKMDAKEYNGGPVIARGDDDTSTGTGDPAPSETHDFGDGGSPDYTPDPRGAEAIKEYKETGKLDSGRIAFDVTESKTYGESYAESPLSFDGSEMGRTDMVYPETFDEYYVPEEPPVPIDGDPYVYVQPSAGLLTSGEWNDNRNFAFLKNLLSDGQSYAYADFFKKWNLSPFNRLVIRCTAPTTASAAPAAAPVSGSAILLRGVSVTVLDESGNKIWKGVTDHEGYAFAYYALANSANKPAKVVAEYNGARQTYDIASKDLLDTAVVDIEFTAFVPENKSLDLMFVVDTTGSMGDEIRYLQAELENVINRVKTDTSNIPLRLSVNFYRDDIPGEEYVVRPYDFSTDIDEQLTYLNKEYASGGGDFEEAVELALANAVNDHKWDEKSIKLLFLVLDAPPHNTDEIKKSLIDTIEKASEMGIRIIPVASSGIDKDTEFLLRAFAMTTGGTYTFLTNDSGIGGEHIEPTVGSYTVEHLNDMMVRIIEEYIG